MNSYNMGYVCWSLSNKPESASLLKASCKKTSGFTGNDLSGQGKWLVQKYKKNKLCTTVHRINTK